MPGSVRDYAILFVGLKNAAGDGGLLDGGNILLNAGQHSLDGPEHTDAGDGARLDATVDHHGLLPVLSGDGFTFLDGLGLWVPGSLIPAGGTTGQVLAKASDTDYDAAWTDDVDPVVPALSDAIPLVESGSGNAGASAETSRADHVHPDDGGGMGGGTGTVDTAEDAGTTVTAPDTIKITGTGGIAVSLSEAPSGTAAYEIDGSGVTGGGGVLTDAIESGALLNAWLTLH